MTDDNLPASRLPGVSRTCNDVGTGLDGIVVLDAPGGEPALGGCRLRKYDCRSTMLRDATRLAKWSAYGHAIAGLPFGGAAAIVNRPGRSFCREALFEAFGRVVDGWHGNYVATVDDGTTFSDMLAVSRSTLHVAGINLGAPRRKNDRSLRTARSVFVSIQRCAQRKFFSELASLTVAVQGVGGVGWQLCAMLRRAGANLVIAELDPVLEARAARAFGARTVALDQFMSVQCDILSPCATGRLVNDVVISRIRARIVCGATTEMLRDPADAKRLLDRGILYAPDFVVNVGGAISEAGRHLGWSERVIDATVDATSERLDTILDAASCQGLTPQAAAIRIAQGRIDQRANALKGKAA